MKLLVKDYLKGRDNKVLTVNFKEKLTGVADLMKKKKVGALIVMDDDNNIAGIIDERDIIVKVVESDGKFNNLLVEDAMKSKEEIIVGTETDDLDYLMKVMTNNRVRHIPIIGHSGELKGIVSVGDTVKALLSGERIKNRFLKDYIG